MLLWRRSLNRTYGFFRRCAVHQSRRSRRQGRSRPRHALRRGINLPLLGRQRVRHIARQIDPLLRAALRLLRLRFRRGAGDRWNADGLRLRTAAHTVIVIGVGSTTRNAGITGRQRRRTGQVNVFGRAILRAFLGRFMLGWRFQRRANADNQQ
ncbi:hypothetical protein D3C80_1511020 [compost metagenome]